MEYPRLYDLLHPLPGIEGHTLTAEFGNFGVQPLETLLAQQRIIQAVLPVHARGLTLSHGLVQHNGTGDRNIERLGHTHHRDFDLLVGLGQSSVADAKQLGAHHQGGRARVTQCPVILRFITKMGGHQLEAPLSEVSTCGLERVMGSHFDPFFRALGGFPVNAQAIIPGHGMQLIDPDCITGPDDGREITGLVQVLSQNCQVRLPSLQHPVELVAPIRGRQVALAREFAEQGTPGKT